MDSFGGTPIHPIVLFVIYAWSLIWKGLALWTAAKHNQRNWFIAILILNTAGILELIYLFRFAKEKLTIEKIKTNLQEVFNKK